MIEFSVILPVYLYNPDHQTDIQLCLKSVLANSHDFELIVVDDASPLDISFLKSKADIFIRHSCNKGVAGSWNSGLKKVTGQYAVIINDDIEVPAFWLEGLKQTLDQGFAVAAPMVEHLPNNPSAPPYQWFPGSCFMLPAQTIEKVGFFDENFSPFFFEDTDYWTRLLKKDLLMGRNFAIVVKHQEGRTVKVLSRDKIYQKNLNLFIKKHGFDPIPVFCGGAPLPWLTKG